MLNYQPTIEEIMKGMEDVWNDKEEEFAMTASFLNLPTICPERGHDASTRDFTYMRWKCVTCGRILEP